MNCSHHEGFLSSSHTTPIKQVRYGLVDLNSSYFSYQYIENGQGFLISRTLEGWYQVLHVMVCDPCGDYLDCLGTFESIRAAIQAIRDNDLELLPDGSELGPINVPEDPNDWWQHFAGFLL
ncbi:MAG: hypothetical protein CMK07_11165 [Ponticaulis sp.]|nr:hypothetical protein [Ponticaulis sp.]